MTAEITAELHSIADKASAKDEAQFEALSGIIEGAESAASYARQYSEFIQGQLNLERETLKTNVCKQIDSVFDVMVKGVGEMDFGLQRQFIEVIRSVQEHREQYIEKPMNAPRAMPKFRG